MEELKIQAEVKQVTAKKLVSLDVNYQVVLQTDNPAVLALGALEGDTMLDVRIKAVE
jgi:hypothetical protein